MVEEMESEEKSVEEASIIEAAGAWASAIEAAAEAIDEEGDLKAKRDAADAALVSLYDAVVASRAAQRPADFTGVRGQKAHRRSNVVRLIAPSSEG